MIGYHHGSSAERFVACFRVTNEEFLDTPQRILGLHVHDADAMQDIGVTGMGFCA
jgi:hypothetical protein